MISHCYNFEDLWLNIELSVNLDESKKIYEYFKNRLFSLMIIEEEDINKFVEFYEENVNMNISTSLEIHNSLAYYESNKEELILRLLSYVFVRLYIFFKVNANSNTLKFLKVYVKWLSKIETGDQELNCPFLLHNSRSFLDSDSASQSSYKSLKNCKHMRKLKETEIENLFSVKYYIQGIEFFKTIIIMSPLFKDAIQKFLISINEDKNIEEAIKIFKLMKFNFITNTDFTAMCGFDSTYHVNLSCLFNFEESSIDSDFNIYRARTISNIIHEGAHIIVRCLKVNFSISTPRSNFNSEAVFNLEAGYRLENIIFGNFRKKYWQNFHMIILDSNVWNYKSNRKLPIFNDEELENSDDRNMNHEKSGFEKN
jgi:hypothetical protein